MRDFRPIEKNMKISHKIVDSMKEMMLSGGLQPGDRLPREQDLCKMMQVSRPTLREALTVLEAMGLIEMRRREGSVVKSVVPRSFQEPIQDMIQVDPWRVLDLFELRERIESEGAALAAERATDTELELIRSYADELEQKLQSKRSILQLEPAKLYRKTVFAIADATHNPIWAHFTKSIWSLLEGAIPFSRQKLLDVPDIWDNLLHQYREIVEYVTERNPTEARNAVIHHLNIQRNQLRKIIESGS